jgi:hypothetical protein
MVDPHEISYHPSCSAIALDHLHILTFSPHHDQKDDQNVHGAAVTDRMLTL